MHRDAPFANGDGVVLLERGPRPPHKICTLSSGLHRLQRVQTGGKGADRAAGAFSRLCPALVDWSPIPLRSPNGILENFDGGTPCAPGRSRCRALGRWPGLYPPGIEMLNEARNRSTASSPPVRHKQPASGGEGAPEDRLRVHTVHLAERSNRWTFDRSRGMGGRRSTMSRSRIRWWSASRTWRTT